MASHFEPCDLLIFVGWLLLNVADFFCIYFYDCQELNSSTPDVQGGAHPNPRSSVNRTSSGWKAYVWFMFIFGIVLSAINFIVCLGCVAPICAWLHDLRSQGLLKSQLQTDSIPVQQTSNTQQEKGAFNNILSTFRRLLHSTIDRTLRITGLRTDESLGTCSGKGIVLSTLRTSWCLLVSIIVGSAAALLCLGPFFSPYAALPLTKEHVWNHQCQSFPVEVVLDGRSYNKVSVTDVPSVASFYFWQNGAREKLFEYVIPYGGTGDAFRLELRGVIPNAVVPPDLYPLVQEVSYVNGKLAGTCLPYPGASSNETRPCIAGSFYNDFLSISINDTRTNTVSNLRAVDKDWTLMGREPSFILRRVNGDNSLGDVVVETAATKRNDCSSLKLCLAEESGLDMLVPLGLALQKQDDFARDCTR